MFGIRSLAALSYQPIKLSPFTKACLAWVGLLILSVAQPRVGAATGPASLFAEEIVTVVPAWSATAIRPGTSITLAIEVRIRAPYHINSNHPKGSFIPTTVDVELPPGLVASTTVFPEPTTIEFGAAGSKETIQVFSGRAIFYVPMAANGSMPVGEYPVRVKVGYQACDEVQCLFPTAAVAATTLRVVAPTEETRPTNPELFADLDALKDRINLAFFGWDLSIKPSNLILLLSMAALGGFLLNLTPCVLPMIPIKIMGLSKAAGNRRRSLLLGMVMSAGVVAFWLGLAGAIAGVSGFTSTNKLFQYPAFTVGVGLVIWAMAIGMCGFFSVSLPQWVYRFQPSQESVTGSFLFGIMTAVLSTPCTAPFMGGAAAWSATQKPTITLLTFGAIGGGMALPYLVLAAFPKLTSKMPRGGPAGDLIKQVMGLLMFAAGAYFLGTGLSGWFVRPPDPPTQAYWWLVALFVVAAGGWLGWRTLQIAKSAPRRTLFAGLGLLLMVLGAAMGIRLTRDSPVHWTYYSPERFAAAQAQSKIIVLEFTAGWCINCHVLERTVLNDASVVAALNSEGVVPIKVDLTGNNDAGDRKLAETGNLTIPFLVIYSTKGNEVFRSDAYTVEKVLAALGRAKQ